jgi:hypothetical protein
MKLLLALLLLSATAFLWSPFQSRAITSSALSRVGESVSVQGDLTLDRISEKTQEVATPPTWREVITWVIAIALIAVEVISRIKPTSSSVSILRWIVTLLQRVLSIFPDRISRTTSKQQFEDTTQRKSLLKWFSRSR